MNVINYHLLDRMESEIPECTVEQLLNILSEKRNYLLHAYIKPLDEVYTNLYIGDELVNFYEIVHNLTVFNLNLKSLYSSINPVLA